MIKSIVEFLEDVKMVVLSGVILALGIILSLLSVDVPIFLNPLWITILISGIPIIYSAMKKLIISKGIRRISSPLLISMALLASVIIGDLFAAAEIAFLMALGELLEHKTTEKARKGLHNLISLTPTQGRIVENDVERIVSADEIRKGDILRILPGETIPVDGVIIEGNTSVDQSVVTGESLPVDKTVGDDVYCATINRFGSIDIKAVGVGEDSSLQKLIRMVRSARDNKAPMQRTADKWASWLVPLALLVAVIAGIVRQDVVVAVTILVVFCPCAMVLATPTAVMAAIGQATRHGVIIKSGEALEKMASVDTVAFDKTGTLTKGKLSVSDVITVSEDYTEDELLSLCASVESRSEHPLGKAIVSKAEEKGIDISDVSDFSMIAGKGVSGLINNIRYYCGSESYLSENNISISSEVQNILSDLRQSGKVSVLISDKTCVLGIVAMSDVLRTEAKSVVGQLASMGVDSVLLTGDNDKTAMYIADKIGISNVRSQLLPEDKVNAVTTLQSEGKKVCMIGDGVNDAPALKTAQVGVAMGTIGSDIAVEAADIALTTDGIKELTYLKRLSRSTLSTIRFGITLSLAINFIAIILSFFGLLNPATGALVHNIGSVIIVLIAAMLYDRDI
ncbi:MAG: cation-translocating P-type ATPase [Ruminococcus sp.]|nr:cation-translocating P-type ATPase [Ruminococcus sp.]